MKKTFFTTLVLALLGGTSVQADMLKDTDKITKLNFDTLIPGKDRKKIREALGGDSEYQNKTWQDLKDKVSEEIKMLQETKDKMLKHCIDQEELENQAKKGLKKQEKTIQNRNKTPKKEIKAKRPKPPKKKERAKREKEKRIDCREAAENLEKSITKWTKLVDITLEKNVPQTEKASYWYTDEKTLPVDRRNEPEPKPK